MKRSVFLFRHFANSPFRILATPMQPQAAQIVRNKLSVSIYHYLCMTMQVCQRKDNDIIGAREEAKKLQADFQDMVKKLRAERDAKIQECEELRTQVQTKNIKMSA